MLLDEYVAFVCSSAGELGGRTSNSRKLVRFTSAEVGRGDVRLSSEVRLPPREGWGWYRFTMNMYILYTDFHY